MCCKWYCWDIQKQLLWQKIQDFTRINYLFCFHENLFLELDQGTECYFAPEKGRKPCCVFSFQAGNTRNRQSTLVYIHTHCCGFLQLTGPQPFKTTFRFLSRMSGYNGMTLKHKGQLTISLNELPFDQMTSIISFQHSIKKYHIPNLMSPMFRI